jgi:hypothetical protein
MGLRAGTGTGVWTGRELWLWLWLSAWLRLWLELWLVHPVVNPMIPIATTAPRVDLPRAATRQRRTAESLPAAVRDEVLNINVIITE